jgi:alpha-glucosidase (family GH31 glycosyl hydrolase)
MFLMYQREQLKKIETSGGALIRPLFTEFESINRENDSSIDMGSVMFGDSILASYQLYDIDTNRTITLPKEANWF